MTAKTNSKQIAFGKLETGATFWFKGIKRTKISRKTCQYYDRALRCNRYAPMHLGERVIVVNTRKPKTKEAIRFWLVRKGETFWYLDYKHTKTSATTARWYDRSARKWRVAPMSGQQEVLVNRVLY